MTVSSILLGAVLIIPPFSIPQYIHSFHPLDKYLLSNYHASGTFLDAEDTAVK